MKKIMLLFSLEEIKMFNRVILYLLSKFKEEKYEIVFLGLDTIYSREVDEKLLNKIKFYSDVYDEYRNYKNNYVIAEDELDFNVIPKWGKFSIENYNVYKRISYSGMGIRGVIEKKITKLSYNYVEKIASNHKPDLILTSQKYCNSLCSFFNLAIPMIGFPFGSIGFHSNKNTYSDTDNAMYFFSNMKYGLLWGEGMKNRILKSGYPKNNLVITGSLENDLVYEKKNNLQEKDRGKILKKYNISKNKTIIFYPWIGFRCFEIYELKKQKKMIDKLFNTLSLLKDKLDKEYVVIFKLHPGDSRPEYSNLVKKIKEYEGQNFKVLSNELDINTLFFISDIMLGSGSSADIESCIFNIPYVFLDYETVGEYDYANFAGIYVKNLKDLLERIYQAYEEDPYQKERKKFLKREFYKIDGKVFKRFKFYIDECIK